MRWRWRGGSWSGWRGSWAGPGLWTPAQTADRLLALPDPTLGGGDYSIYAKRERWAIRQCTHLVSYLYPALLEPENQQYLYAQNCGLTLYDLTSPDTAAFLAEQAGRLPERQRLALSLRLEGRAQKEAEAALGVRGPAFRRLAQQAAWGLEQAARRRLLGDPAWQAEAPPCCGVFALGPPDYENLSLFEGAVQFVAARYGIRRFYVAAEYCHSGYMKVLKMAAQSLGGCHVTAAAGCQEVTPALEARLAFQFCPPCQEVELILAPAKRPRARDLTVAKALMQRCDFCICDLYGTPWGQPEAAGRQKGRGGAAGYRQKKYRGRITAPVSCFFGGIPRRTALRRAERCGIIWVFGKGGSGGPRPRAQGRKRTGRLPAPEGEARRKERIV